MNHRGAPYKIRPKDIVLLPDGSEGTVLEVLNTDSVHVYKIDREGSVNYFDESKVRLKEKRRLLIDVVLKLVKKLVG